LKIQTKNNLKTKLENFGVEENQNELAKPYQKKNQMTGLKENRELDLRLAKDDF
jgi:hypothetical protein